MSHIPEKRKKFIELDILRIISCLIVVVIIHIPNNYAYPITIELSQYGIFMLHTLGIFTAMGSFVFISGFTLMIKKKSQKETKVANDGRERDNTEIKEGKRERKKKKNNKFHYLKSFLKNRFIRIVPLYWMALTIFLILFTDSSTEASYIISHIFGLQIFMAPRLGYPIWTIWFIGILLLYYLIFIFLNYLDSIKKIIPAAILILFGLILLRLNFRVIEYRFFLYYILFIAGIIAAKIYNSPQFKSIKQKLVQKHKFLPDLIIFFVACGTGGLYYVVTRATFAKYNMQYGIMGYLNALRNIYYLKYLRFDPLIAIGITVLIILLFLITILSALHLIGTALKAIFKESNVERVISIIAYPTYCVYLFHRPIIMLLSAIVTGIFNIDMFARSNFYIALLFVPIIFLISYCIQKTYDWIVAKVKHGVKTKKKTLEKAKIETEATPLFQEIPSNQD
jgi:peptidoglycan/LPS O-acetylase OafA/YrhL